MKSEQKHHYHIYWSVWKQLSFKKSLLRICKILSLFVNTLTADDKYSLLNRDILKSSWNFQHFQQIDDAHSWCISQNTDSVKQVRQCLISPACEDVSKSNMVNGTKHCRNLSDSIITIFIDQCEGKWVAKSLCYWHTKSEASLLTH